MRATRLTTKVILPHWRKIINEKFIPLVNNKDRYLILYGSRGSSKSDFVAKKLIKRCLAEPYFRYILYRKTYNTIKDSQFQNIKDIVYEWGLQDLFTFTENPLSIKCYNGNRFICRGGDEPKKLKSVKDPTGVWYEEEIPEEGDFITITTSIRTKKCDYLQEIFSINPEVEGDYTEHWFWRRFFGVEAEDGSWVSKREELSFNDTTIVTIPSLITFAKDADGRAIRDERGEPMTVINPAHDVELTYTVHHSTYKDNRWIPDTFIAQLMKLAEQSEYYYLIYSLGLWANKKSGLLFYKLFDRAKNVIKLKEYQPSLALHLTFDFNVHPYVTLNVHQMQEKHVWQIDEITLASPKNTTAAACEEFINRYKGHVGGVFIYGDPAGLHEDTRSEKGFNDFTIISKSLAIFRPQTRYQRLAPPVVARGRFINDCFKNNYEGITIEVCENCRNTIADYTNLKEASDGTKYKVKVKDKNTGVTFEKYGHCSDANDYFYCVVFAQLFTKHMTIGVFNKPKTANHVSKSSY